MTEIYIFHIRYYKIGKKSGRKMYRRMDSIPYAFCDICSDAMRDSLRMIDSNKEFGIDSYWIESVFLDEKPADLVFEYTRDADALPF